MEPIKLTFIVFFVLTCQSIGLACTQCCNPPTHNGSVLICYQHGRHFGSRVQYYPNSSATFQLRVLRSNHHCGSSKPLGHSCWTYPHLISPLLSGDVETNPGPDGQQHNPSDNRSARGMTCCLMNARSLRNKIPELEVFINTARPDIVCITETWLDSSIADSTLAIPDDYVVLRRDRPGRRGGGVLIGVHQGLSPVPVTCDGNNIEIVWASICIRNSSWLIGVLYRPPNSSPSFWNHLQDHLDAVNMQSYDGCLLLGDFNTDMSIHANSPNRNCLIEIMNDAGLVQMVSSITHPTPGDYSTGSIIDLVFTNCVTAVMSVDTIPSPVTSDHNAVYVRFRSLKPAPMPSVLRSFLRVHQGDFDHLRNLLHLIPWNALLDAKDPDKCCETFTDIFHSAVKDSIPSTTKRKSRCCPWISEKLKKLITKKHYLFRSAKRTKDIVDWNKYKGYSEQT